MRLEASITPGRYRVTIVIGQNLNQLRQKHLWGVRALQTLAGSSIYRKVTIISPPKDLVPRFRVILGSTQGYTRVTEKFLMCCALTGHFEDMMLGTCYFSCRVRLALTCYIQRSRTTCCSRQTSILTSRFMRRRDMRPRLLGLTKSTRRQTFALTLATNGARRNRSWGLDVVFSHWVEARARTLL